MVEFRKVKKIARASYRGGNFFILFFSTPFTSILYRSITPRPGLDLMVRKWTFSYLTVDQKQLYHAKVWGSERSKQPNMKHHAPTRKYTRVLSAQAPFGNVRRCMRIKRRKRAFSSSSTVANAQFSRAQAASSKDSTYCRRKRAPLSSNCN